MTIPEVYRRADIGKIAQAVVTPAVPAVPAGVPAAGASMDDWEGLIDFITRFSTQFERVIGIIKGVQDGQNGNSPASGQPKETEFTTATEPAAAAPTLTVTPAIPPILVYQKLLGYLAKAPPETTAAELLEMAKEHKDAVLATIKEAISEVTTNVRA